MKVKCPDCDGKGWFYAFVSQERTCYAKDKCYLCGGSGKIFFRWWLDYQLGKTFKWWWNSKFMQMYIWKDR